MLCDDTYSLGVNFVTLNAYLCCEINAHGLTNLLIKLKNRPELFNLWRCSSQPCEAFFRALRSLSSIFSTQVNFTMKDLFVSRCQQVDSMIRLTAQGMKDGIVYPRERRAFDSIHSSQSWEMPSMEEIEQTFMRAKMDAEKDLIDLGRNMKFDSRLYY